MSKASALLAGIGLGAASGYMGQKEKAASEARLAAIRAGQTPPTETRPIDTIIGKVKDAFTTKAPDVVSPTQATPAIQPQSSAAPAANVVVPSVETAAFNDDKTVPNESELFQNSYA